MTHATSRTDVGPRQPEPTNYEQNSEVKELLYFKSIISDIVIMTEKLLHSVSLKNIPYTSETKVFPNLLDQRRKENAEEGSVCHKTYLKELYSDYSE